MRKTAWAPQSSYFPSILVALAVRTCKHASRSSRSAVRERVSRMAHRATESGYETLPDTGEGRGVTPTLPGWPGVLLRSGTAAHLPPVLPSGLVRQHSPVLPSSPSTDDLPGPARSQPAPAAALSQHRPQQQHQAFGQPLVGQRAGAAQGDHVVGVPAFPQPQYSPQPHRQQQQGIHSFPPCELKSCMQRAHRATFFLPALATCTA